jgi:hypothetical protein
MEFAVGESSAELKARLARGELTVAEREVETGRTDPLGAPRYGSLRWKIGQAEAAERVMDREVTNMIGVLRERYGSLAEIRSHLERCLCRDTPWRIHPDARAAAALCALSDDEVDKVRIELSETLPVLYDVVARERDESRVTLGEEFPQLEPVWAWCRRDMPFAGAERKAGDKVDLLQSEWAPRKLAKAIDPDTGSFVVTADSMAAAARACALNGAASRWLANEPTSPPPPREPVPPARPLTADEKRARETARKADYRRRKREEGQ